MALFKNEMDAGIDAFKKEIEEILNQSIHDLRRADSLKAVTARWYDENTVNMVHSAVAEGREISRTLLEQNIVPESEPAATAYAAYVDRSKTLLNTEYSFSLTAMFKGENDERKATFLQNLKNQAQSLLGDIQAELGRAQASLEETRLEKWEDFDRAHKVYKDLSAAIESEYPVEILDILRSDIVKDIQAQVWSGLLSMPMHGQSNVLTAVAQLKFPNAADEAEIVDSIVRGYDDDLKALAALNDARTLVEKHNDVHERYTNHVKKLTGLLLPMPYEGFLNTDRLATVTYDAGAGKLYTYFQNQSEDDFKADDREAKSIMDTLAGNPNFIGFGTNALHIDTIMTAAFDADTGEMTVYSHDSDENYYGDADFSAEKQYQALAENPRFVEIGGELHNLRAVTNITYDKSAKTFLIDFTDNLQREYEVSAAEAKQLEKMLMEKHGFIKIGQDIHNPLNIIEAQYDKDGNDLCVYYINETSMNYTMKPAEFSAVVTALKKHPGFISVDSVTVANLNILHEAEYDRDSEELTLHYKTEQESVFDMKKAEAHRLLDKMGKVEGFIRTVPDVVNNVGEIVDIEFEENGMKIFFAYGYSSNFDMTEEGLSSFKADILKRPSIIEIEGGIHNLRNMTHGYATDDGVEIYYTNEGSNTYKLEENDAGALLEKLRAKGRDVALQDGPKGISVEPPSSELKASFYTSITGPAGFAAPTGLLDPTPSHRAQKFDI